jgi:hypothetical protein
MQYTNNQLVNQRIDEVNQWIKQWLPSIQSVDRKGFRSTSYFLQKGMEHERVYIICYDQKANLGFSQGIHLSKVFPFLEGKGKTHRHIDIMAAQLENTSLIKKLILAAFEVKEVSP